MKKNYYIYLMVIIFLFIVSMIYISYNNITLKENTFNSKSEKQYFLDKKPKNIDNANITNSNKF